jgi:hypothetical protein
MRNPIFRADGSEKVQNAGWTYTTAFLAAVKQAAKADDMTASAWVKSKLLPDLKAHGLWPPKPPAE